MNTVISVAKQLALFLIFLFDWFILGIPVSTIGVILFLVMTNWKDIGECVNRKNLVIGFFCISWIFIHGYLGTIRPSSLAQISLSLLCLVALHKDSRWLAEIRLFVTWFIPLIVTITAFQMILSYSLGHDVPIGNPLLSSPQRNLTDHNGTLIQRASALYEEPAHNAIAMIAASVMAMATRKFILIVVAAIGSLITLSAIGIIFSTLAAMVILAIFKKIKYIVVCGTLICAVALLTPAFDFLISKLSGINTINTSGWVRVIGPWLYLQEAWSPWWRSLVGAGLGQHMQIIQSWSLYISNPNTQIVGPNSFSGVITDFGMIFGVLLTIYKYQFLRKNGLLIIFLPMLLLFDFAISAYYRPWYWLVFGVVNCCFLSNHIGAYSWFTKNGDRNADKS